MFCEVAEMESCRCGLEVYYFRGHEFLKGGGSLIIKSLDTWFEAVGL